MLDGSLKSLLPLWESLATNPRYSSYVDEEDISTFMTRAENEGLHFLTTVLPRIGKALDAFFATKHWEIPVGFEAVRFEHAPAGTILVLSKNESGSDNYPTSYALPIFMSKAISFALGGDSLAVDCVRQLTLMFYKYGADYDETTVATFLDQFIQTDLGLPDLSGDTNDSRSRLLRGMRSLIGRVLTNANPLDIRPCHGGGATACRTQNHEKYQKLRYYPKLDEVFSYDAFFFYSPTHLIDEYEKLEKSVESIPRARVCLVPKDSRGPRIISCEPAELMFIQQGLMRKLYTTIEAHPLTAGRVNFTDQTINQGLACAGSVSDATSTLDLTDASDRVSLDLVRLVFPANWVRAFEACRSESTVLPDGRVVELRKFAPMGSSCCFPVEALVFWACAEAVTRISPELTPGHTYVYGDDIVCDRKNYDSIVEGLHSIGLKVNLNKSYKSGPFRESCGFDAHKGFNVTPVRLRKDLLSRETGVVEGADLANLFIAKYGYKDSIPLIQTIERQIGYVLPRSYVELPGSILVEEPPVILTGSLRGTASNDVFFNRRWSKDLQRTEHRILCLSNQAIAWNPPNWGELLRKELARDVTVTRYDNWTKIHDSFLEPGQYVDLHSTHLKWKHTWLG